MSLSNKTFPICIKVIKQCPGILQELKHVCACPYHPSINLLCHFQVQHCLFIYLVETWPVGQLRTKQSQTITSESNEWQDYIGSSRDSCQTAVAKRLLDYSSRKFKRTEIDKTNKSSTGLVPQSLDSIRILWMQLANVNVCLLIEVTLYGEITFMTFKVGNI